MNFQTEAEYQRFFKFDISNSIRGVFCGIEFPDVYMDSLKNLTKYLNVDVYNLYINDGIPSLITRI